ncbi:MAG: hypothetical protein WC496_10350 [Phycisphaerae bacterium]
MGSNPTTGFMAEPHKIQTDTSREVLEIQYELYRKMSSAEKIELIFDAIRTGQILSMTGIRMQYPNADEKQVWHIWAKRHLGEELYNKVYGGKNE